MNSISPYTIRCYDPHAIVSGGVGAYTALGTIGSFDTYKIIKGFIESKGAGYHDIKETKQIYSFSGFSFNDATREIRGLLKAGSYGSRTDIINIDTGAVDFERLEKNAEVLRHYVRFFIPEKLNEGVVLLHNQKNVGIKTLLYDLLKKEFSRITGRTMQMNPLAYEKAFSEWGKAQAKEIKLVKFTGMGAIEDQIKKLGHDELEQTYAFKAPRKQGLGSLLDYFTPGTEQHNVVELLSPLCSEVKTVVEMGGRKRTFRLGGNPTEQVCEIEVDEKKVTVTAGNPNMKELDGWCKILLNEFLAAIYPNMGIKV